MCESSKNGCDSNNNTHVKQLLSPTRTGTQEKDEASVCLTQHMQRLERGVVDGLDKLAQSGRNNLHEILDAIKDCKKTMVHELHNVKGKPIVSDRTELESLRETVHVLMKEKGELE
jgi:hypothetical protein